MLKAGALIYALLIAFVMSITASAFIALVSLNSDSYQIIRIEEELIRNCDSGIQYLLSKNPAEKKEGIIDLFGEERDSLQWSLNHWGLFEMGRVDAFHGKFHYSKSCLIGTNGPALEKTALYLTDLNAPLSLGGNTEIIGNAFLPKLGVKRAYIEGKSYSGRKMIYGLKYESKKFLPEIDQSMLERLNAVFSEKFELKDSLSRFEYIENDTVRNGFDQPLLVLKGNGLLQLSNVSLEGRIVIISDSLLFVERSCNLKNVMLFAPKIVIERGFEGTCQAFATKSLYVEENVYLKYPSSVGLLRKNAGDDQGLFIEKNAEIEGNVFLSSEVTDIRNRAAISIEKGAQIWGLVFSKENLMLKGEVYGSVYCNKFQLKTASAYYENHLFDAKIDVTMLPEEFAVGSLLQKKTNRKLINSWVN